MNLLLFMAILSVPAYVLYRRFTAPLKEAAQEINRAEELREERELFEAAFAVPATKTRRMGIRITSKKRFRQ